MARERNRSAVKWSLAAIGVWIGAEFTVGFVLVFSVFLSSELLGTPEDPETMSGLAYIPALVAALFGAEFMIRRLRAKPTLLEQTEDHRPRPPVLPPTFGEE